jgi:signal transduction histidine kinase/DNA-binding response OmpR family regulator
VNVAESDLRNACILVVDDEEANVDLLVSCLTDEGYARVLSTRDSREVAGIFAENQPDLILLDLHMPWLDGFAILDHLRKVVPADEYLPILVLTADVAESTKQRALSVGARDFLTKPLNITEALLRIRNLLETRYLHQQQRRARKEAQDATRRATILAEASEVLASSFDYNTTLSVLCQRLVPAVADYCVVDVLMDDGTVARVGAAHVDPAKEPLLREVSHVKPGVLPKEHPAMAALLEGQRTLAREITPAMVTAVTANEDHEKIIEQLRPKSLIAAPIRASGRIHGALQLVCSESGRLLEREDLDLASELARRAALTIENARLYQQAQEATRAREELLAIVAHDLRSPLSTITMLSGILGEDAAGERQRRNTELLAGAARTMNRLIEDLLDMTRIESGKLKIERKPHRISSLIRESVGMLTPLAESRRISLTATFDESLPMISIDSTRILQVLSNLVGNAIKFTPAGGRVTVACERMDGEVRFAVTDTGPGIRRDQIPHIFGRLWQGNEGDRRGIGLGLSIARGIVETHGGKVWVESEAGQGATFFFTLPVDTEAGTGAATTNPGLATPNVTG